jgi:hypothetical protein
MPVCRVTCHLVLHFSFQGFLIKVSSSSFDMTLRYPRIKGYCLRLIRSCDSDLASEGDKEEPNGTVSPAGSTSILVRKIRSVLCIPHGRLTGYTHCMTTQEHLDWLSSDVIWTVANRLHWCLFVDERHTIFNCKYVSRCLVSCTDIQVTLSLGLIN